jgi:hypothetical protein
MSVFFNALTVDPCSLDAELEDAGTVGPELAFIAKEQRLLARAFCWRDANSDWPLLLVQIPGTEALWTLQHPVFTHSTLGHGIKGDWHFTRGHGLRFSCLAR